jgi:hypothetical protein
MLPDYYKTLGVAHDADRATIKKAVLRLYKKYHEDKPENQNKPEALKKAQEIGEAYSVLGKVEERRKYDEKWEAECGGTASSSAYDSSPEPPTPNLKANPSHIAFGDVVLGSTCSKIITVRNVGDELDNPSIRITFDPLIEGFEWGCIPASAANPFPIKISVTYSCSPETAIGAISTDLVISLNDVNLEILITCNIIAEDISFSTYGDAPDVADDDVIDDDDSDHDDDDSAPDFTVGGVYGSTSSPPPSSSTASSRTAYSTVGAPLASAPVTKKGWFWKFVCSYIAANLFYSLSSYLAFKILPGIFAQPPQWSVVLVEAWLVFGTVLLGASTFFALRGSSGRASSAGKLLLYTTVVVIGIVAVTAMVSRNALAPSKSDLIIPPNTVIFDDFNNASVGVAYGIDYGTSQLGQHTFHAAAFTESKSSRIEYPRNMPDQGTLEFWVYVKDGYYWHDSKYYPQQKQAMIFSTDAYGGDVTWPGAAKLVVASNGDITFFIAEHLGNNPPSLGLKAQKTGFTFNQWHAVGISYGGEGEAIMVDGKVVGRQPNITQKLGAAGNHEGPKDIPTIGETVSHFFPRHSYDGGFEGFVSLFRASRVQQDWYFARGMSEDDFRSSQPSSQSQTNGENQSVMVSPGSENQDVATKLLNATYPSNCWELYANDGIGRMVTVKDGGWDNGQSQLDKEAYFQIVGKKVALADLEGNGHQIAVVQTVCGLESVTSGFEEVFVLDPSSSDMKVLHKFSWEDWSENSLGTAFRTSDVKVGNGELSVSYFLGGSRAQPDWDATTGFRWDGRQFVRVDFEARGEDAGSHAHQTIHKVMPIDEGFRDSSFLAFRDDLSAAVKQKDSAYLYKVTSPTVGVGFGAEPNTRDEFMQMWNVNAPDSKVWDTLTEILENGGYFVDFQGRRQFTAPYTFSGWPQSVDSFVYCAVSAPKASLYSQPDTGSSVVGTLSYDLVKPDGGCKNPEWQKVSTDTGLSGFLQTKYLRSPIDYRATFEVVGGRWMLVSLVAGD